MTQRALGLLGLGVRARTVVVGVSGVRAVLQRGEVALVVVAGDHSSRTGEKVVRLARARGVPVLLGPSAAELGRCVGRRAVQAVGVRDARLAEGLLASGEQALRRA